MVLDVIQFYSDGVCCDPITWYWCLFLMKLHYTGLQVVSSPGIRTLPEFHSDDLWQEICVQ